MLSCLAEIGYPPGERSLMPLLEQVYQWLLSPQHLGSVKTIAGRARRCASQEGNAVYYAPEKKYYRVSEKAQSGASCVDWGSTSSRKMSEFVTLEALLVLHAAGWLEIGRNWNHHISSQPFAFTHMG